MASPKFRAGTIIRTILKADPEISKRVKHIRPITAPKTTDGDFIVYQRNEYSKNRNNMGTIDTCNVFVSCVSSDYDRSIELAELVDKAIDREHKDLEVVGQLIDSTEDEEDGKYIQTLLYSLT